jgi:hypothetical protein
MKGFKVYNGSLGYLHVEPDSVVAIIKNGLKIRSQANGKNLELDASKSFDSDTGTPQGLSFTWLCRISGESFPGNALDYPLVEIPVFFPDTNIPYNTVPYKRGGCYGTGAGKIPGNKPLLVFGSYYIVVNTTYVFSVILNSGNRRAKFVQEIQVIPGKALDVSIR